MKQIVMYCSMAVLCIALCAASAPASGPDTITIGQAEKVGQTQEKPTPGKDLFDLIKQDHQKIRQIFDQTTGPSGQASPAPREIVRNLKAELVPHMIAEEKTLYTELAKRRETREIAKKTMAEHQDLKQTLGELDSLKDNEINSSPKIAEMRQIAGNHFRNEETVLFRRARNNLDPNELANLAERYQQEKQKAMERP